MSDAIPVRYPVVSVDVEGRLMDPPKGGRPFSGFLMNGGSRNIGGSSGTMATPVRYVLSPPVGRILLISQVIITMSNADIKIAENFAGIPTLANGVQLVLEDSGAGGPASALYNFTQGQAAVNSCDIVTLAPDAIFFQDQVPVAKPDTLVIPLSLKNIHGHMLMVKTTEQIALLVRDDLTGLPIFNIRIQGLEAPDDSQHAQPIS